MKEELAWLKALLPNFSLWWWVGLAVAVVLFLAVCVVMVRRWRLPAVVTLATKAKSPAQNLRSRLFGWLRPLHAAVSYLLVTKAWRYDTPWVVVLGGAQTGKTSLLQSLPHELLRAAPARAADVQVAGVSWHFLVGGAVLDLQREEGDAEAVKQARYRMFRDLDRLRPERPLDGLVLCVSAAQLQQSGLRELNAAADAMVEELAQLQQQIEFVLPVYVVITQCDRIAGFSAFWEAQDPAARTQMFGWSAPASAQNATPEESAQQAFSFLLSRLLHLQVERAAESQAIPNADPFFLFPRQLQRLLQPFSEWLAVVFKVSAWNAGYWLRGIYLTGSIAAEGVITEKPRQDVSFVRDLFATRVLAESKLARPTRRGVWSRNRLIRGLQALTVILFCGLFLALGLSALKASNDIDALARTIEQLQDNSNYLSRSQECLEREVVYRLIEDVSQLDIRPVYWPIPSSWIDHRMTNRSATKVANTVLQNVVFPSLACRLSVKATELMQVPVMLPAIEVRRGFDKNTQHFVEHLNAIRVFEDSFSRFRHLAYERNSVDKDDQQVRELSELAKYAYGAELPDKVKHDRGGLGDGLDHILYKGVVPLPAGFKVRMNNQLDSLSTQLRRSLEQEVGRGSDLLALLNAEKEPLLEETVRFVDWLGWVRQSWLGATRDKNPCENFRTMVQDDVKALVGNYGYADSLQHILNKFDEMACFRPSLKVIEGLHIAPYGNFFVHQNKLLEVNPDLLPELIGLPALMQLGYMKMPGSQDFRCNFGEGWRAAEVKEAAGYVAEYENFAKLQKMPIVSDKPARPLYDRVARSHLLRALDDAMFRSQLPSVESKFGGLQAVSDEELTLAQRSADFARISSPLKTVINAYRELGFEASAASIGQCARDFSREGLARVNALASTSRLYAPTPQNGSGTMFNLGDLPRTKAYLSAQLARSQVLAAYASPFIELLRGTPSINEARVSPEQTDTYWNNTVNELNKFTQAKAPTGQVAVLENYVGNVASLLEYGSCSKTLAAYKAEAGGFDLFSDRRKALESQVNGLCKNRTQALAQDHYQRLVTRFNADLGGRYPFAETAARDVSPQALRAFFNDYPALREGVLTHLDDFPIARQSALKRFIQQLDEVQQLFAGNILQADAMQPLNLALGFKALPKASPGSEQVASWMFSAGGQSATFPNRVKPLAWLPGQALALDLSWATQSFWRPIADLTQPSLHVDEQSAVFAAANGNWSLLRFIDAHRASAAAQNQVEGDDVLLEFNVPIQYQRTDKTQTIEAKPTLNRARFYLTLKLSTLDPKTKAVVALRLPERFPQVAP